MMLEMVEWGWKTNSKVQAFVCPYSTRSHACSLACLMYHNVSLSNALSDFHSYCLRPQMLQWMQMEIVIDLGKRWNRAAIRRKNAGLLVFTNNMSVLLPPSLVVKNRVMCRWTMHITIVLLATDMLKKTQTSIFVLTTQVISPLPCFGLPTKR